jgi:WD40 repeat protein
MTDRIDFETRLQERLRVRAALASRPFDAAAIAREAVAVSGRRRRQFTMSRLEARRLEAPRLAGVAVVIILLALAVAIVGSKPRVPTPIGPAANGLVAFEGDDAIYVAQVDGSERRRISGASAFPRAPEFSPDGTLLAFISSSSQDIGGPLFVVPTDGSQPPVNVSGDVVVARAYYPAISWSPDGSHIAFAGNDRGTTAVFVAASDGSGATAITDAAAIHDLPSWSPDGSFIAYRIVAFDRSSRSLAIARPDGSQERILTSVTGRESSLSVARWSPDGTQLAYYRIAPDDSRAFRIDLNGQETSLWPEKAGSHADTGIPWAPDGRSIALFTSAGLVVVDAAGGDPRPLGNVAYCWIEWSPDGELLYGPQGDHCGGPVRAIPVAHPELATTLMEGMLSWQRVAP